MPLLLRLLLAVSGLLLAAGCGSGDGPVALGTTEYDGPLEVSRADSVHPSARAAGNVVDCRAWGRGGYAGAGTYAEGATSSSPAKALVTASSEGGYGGVQTGLVVARSEKDRVLYVVEVDGVVKQAVIVRDGPATKGAGGPGWYVESWAHCDPAELPTSYADSIGLQVWTDPEGAPVPTTRVASYRGPAHCSWESMTFLYLGEDTYVRDPQPDLANFFAAPYAEHARLPADAIATDFARDGKRLWVSPDRARAYVGTESDVEVWPRTTEPLGCA